MLAASLRRTSTTFTNRRCSPYTRSFLHIHFLLDRHSLRGPLIRYLTPFARSLVHDTRFHLSTRPIQITRQNVLQERLRRRLRGRRLHCQRRQPARLPPRRRKHVRQALGHQGRMLRKGHHVADLPAVRQQGPGRARRARRYLQRCRR